MLMSICSFVQMLKTFCYFAALTITVLRTAKAQSDSYGTEFVTLFPWNNNNPEGIPTSTLSFDIINPSEKETATVRLDYSDFSFGYETLPEKRQVRVFVAPQSHVTHVLNATTMSEAISSENTGSSIHQVTDARIYITSNIPVSIVQHSYIKNGTQMTGDSFAVWPKSMSGKRYAFSLPESVGGYSIIYFIPTEGETTISLRKITSQLTEDLPFTARGGKGLEIQAYRGPSEELTMFVTGNAPFQIIVAMERMLLSVSSRKVANFGCTMLLPIPGNDTFPGCASTPQKDDFDVHYAPLSRNDGDANLFTVTQPADSCTAFEVISLRRNMWSSLGPLKRQNTWVFGLAIKWTIEPTKLQHVQQMQHVNGSISAFMQSTTALMQILRFGTKSTEGPFLDLVPAYTQYVTGRTYIVTHDASDEFIMVFSDTEVHYDKNNMKVIAEETIHNAIHTVRYTLFSPTSSGLHYVESEKGNYVVFVACSKQYSCGYVASLNQYSSKLFAPGKLYDPEAGTPDTYGRDFVTMFPWNIDDIKGVPLGELYFYIINSHPYAPAQLHISYNDFNYNNPDSVDESTAIQIDVAIPPTYFLQVDFPATVKSKVVYDREKNIYRTGDSRIHVTSDIPVTILQNNYIMDNLTGDTFLVLPKTMAGQKYALSLPASSLPTGANAVYFIPTQEDTSIELTIVEKDATNKFLIASQAKKDSPIYVYNGTNKPFTLYASGSAPFLVLISMQRFYLNQTSKSYPDIGNAMPPPVPENACPAKPIRDDYDIHYFPFLAAKAGTANLYTITAPQIDCEPFYVVKYSDKKKPKKWTIDPKKVQPLLFMEHETNEKIAAVHSNIALLQMLFFNTNNEWGLYVDFIPAYSQYITGEMYAVYDNDYYESLIVISDSDEVKVDGKFYKPKAKIRSPFHTIYYTSVHDLTLGLHHIEVQGKYMLFTNFRGAPYYGYPVAYNKPSEELLKPGKVFDPKVDTADTIDFEFVSSFPFQNDEEAPSSMTQLGMDIINPHPYFPAQVHFTYSDFDEIPSATGPKLKITPRQQTLTVFPKDRYSFYFNATARTKTQYERDENIYRSADSRVHVKSDVPVALFQHNYLENATGDSFALLPKSMAGQRYAFTLPNSLIGNYSVYFIPIEKETHINFIVITLSSTKHFAVTARMEPNSPLYLYKGSGEALSMFLWGDAPFLVIISMQKFFMLTQPDSHPGYGATMPIPIPETACPSVPIKDEFDIHYSFLSQVNGASNLFTITPPIPNCGSFFVVKYSNVKPAIKWLIEPNQLQPLIFEKHEIDEIIIGMQSSNALMQVLRFGSDAERALFADVVPSYTQYVSGRTYFCIDNVENEFITILTDTDTVTIDEQYQKPIGTYNGPFHTIYIVQVDSLAEGVHYVEAEGKYMAFLTHANDFDYGYAVAFNKYSEETFKPGKFYDAHVSRPDSVGLEFVTVFPGNNEDPVANSTVELSLDIINYHTIYPAQVIITYNDFSGYETSTDDLSAYARNASLIVSPGSYMTFTFGGSILSKLSTTENPKIHRSLDARIQIFSDCPISVVQHNYLSDGTGDSFTVLPKSMAGQKFAFSLPKSPDGLSVVYFLPMENECNIRLTVASESGTNSFEIKYQKEDGNFYLYAYCGPGEEAITMYASSDTPFQVIVSVRRLLLQSSMVAKNADFGSTMLTAIPENACPSGLSREDFDIHYALMIPSSGGSDQFTITAPEQTCSAFLVNQFFTGSKPSARLSIEPEVVQPFHNWNSGDASQLVTVQSSLAFLQILRFGSASQVGSFIDMVPSFSQYVRGRTYFIIRDQASEYVTLFFDETRSIELDGNRFGYNDSSTNMHIDNSIRDIVYRNISKLTPGLHFIESKWKYMIFITSVGTNGRFYGYVPSIRNVKDLEVPEVTESPFRPSPGSVQGSEPGSNGNIPEAYLSENASDILPSLNRSTLKENNSAIAKTRLVFVNSVIIGILALRELILHM